MRIWRFYICSTFDNMKMCFQTNMLAFHTYYEDFTYVDLIFISHCQKTNHPCDPHQTQVCSTQIWTRPESYVSQHPDLPLNYAKSSLIIEPSHGVLHIYAWPDLFATPSCARVSKTKQNSWIISHILVRIYFFFFS